MNNGWISCYRQLEYHWLWQDKPFAMGQAWVDLLMMANHSESKFPLGSEIITAKPGEVITSEKGLANKWGWSRTKVRKFLGLLEKDSMITWKSDKKKTTISIVNYCAYQDSENRKKTQKKPRKNHKRTAEEPQKNTINNVNNVNNNINSVGVDIYNMRARELVEELVPVYWNRQPTKKDIEYARDKIVTSDGKDLIVDETKVEFLRYAFEQSGFANKMSWQYITGVFKRLANRGIDMVDKLMDFEIDTRR